MKTKTKILGLAIGTGVLASLVVGGAGFQGQTFDTPETSAAIVQTLPFDESQETGGNYPVSIVTLPHEVAFDESQESGGSYPVSKVTLPLEVAFDEDQEGGAPLLR